MKPPIVGVMGESGELDTPRLPRYLFLDGFADTAYALLWLVFCFDGLRAERTPVHTFWVVLVGIMCLVCLIRVVWDLKTAFGHQEQHDRRWRARGNVAAFVVTVLIFPVWLTNERLGMPAYLIILGAGSLWSFWLFVNRA